MSCAACPNYILEAVRAPVEKATAEVRSIKKRVSAVNGVLTSIIGDATASVDAVVATIPTAPTLDLTELASVLACPVTPLALALDASVLSDLDPRALYARVQTVIADFTAKVIASYEAGLAALTEFSVVKQTKRFLDDLLRISLDAVTLAEAVAISTFVETACPQEFLDGPYDEFNTEITGFSLTGVIPSGLDSKVESLILKLQEGEVKIVAWRVVAAIPPPF